ncbi:MAG: sulfurtransferase [Sphingobacteriales bacterium]|nr:MAG: sulfurtransferase [Sphingobacteriales bacterium]
MLPAPHSDRYSRHLQLPQFNASVQAQLTAARVLVIGAGGLGVPALQYLAGAGIGTLGILDGDHVSLSNLHRQVLYTTADVGQLKAIVAAQKLRALNPEIEVIAFPEMLSTENALERIAAYDIVVDGTDNFAARYLINDACVLLGKPFVYGAAHQYEGHVSVFNLGNGPTYRCLYPVPPAAGQIPDCNTGGVLGMVPGMIGIQQALEVVKLITGIGQSLSGALQVYDLLDATQYRIALKAVPHHKTITALQEQYELQVCDSPAADISVTQLLDWMHSGKAFQLLDVRNPEAFKMAHLSNAVNAPLASMDEGLPEFSADVPTVVYCQRGRTSLKAIEQLQQYHPAGIFVSLTGGMNAWNAQTTRL